jgi:hypothetical protein
VQCLGFKNIALTPWQIKGKAPSLLTLEMASQNTQKYLQKHGKNFIDFKNEIPLDDGQLAR